MKAVNEIARTRELTSQEKALLTATYEFMRYARLRDARITAYNKYAQERNKLFTEQGRTLRGD